MTLNESLLLRINDTATFSPCPTNSWDFHDAGSPPRDENGVTSGGG